MKLFLYCNKTTPYLIHESGCYDSDDMCCAYDCFSVVDRQELYNQDISLDETYNGKIVAECDFEVEKIIITERGDYNYDCFSSPEYCTNTLSEEELCEKSCLYLDDIDEYLDLEKGYAIHIKNLHIFTYPRELSDFEYTTKSFDGIRLRAVLLQAPQNMRKIIANGTDAILMSIKPQLLCKILNGEKTIEVRKKVLKEMLKNG